MTSSPLLRFSLALLLCASPCATLPAQVRFEVRAENGAAGQPIVAGLNQVLKPTLYIVNPAGAGAASIQGFQMAISYDPAYLEFQSATWRGGALETPTLRAGAGPEDFLVQKVAGANPGVTMGVVFERLATNFFLGAGEWKVAVLSMKAIKITPDGSPTAIGFAAELGTPPIDNRYDERTSGEAPVAATAGLPVTIGGELAYTVGFRDPRLTVEPGTEVTAAIMVQNSPRAVDGFSFGVKHDPAGLTLLEVALAEGITTVLGGPADDRFLSINKSPAGGSGFTVAMILSAQDQTKVLDPAKSPHHVVDARYQPKLASGSTQLTVTSELGQPKVEVILDLSGTPQRPLPPQTNPPPTVLTVEVRSTGEQRFIRGDVDQNRRITITDTIGILRYLFDGANLLDVFKATVQNCLIAFNVNGDAIQGGMETEADINVTDAVHLLNFLFQAGPPPPAPFGNGRACQLFTGQASERLKCTQFACE